MIIIIEEIIAKMLNLTADTKKNHTGGGAQFKNILIVLLSFLS